MLYYVITITWIVGVLTLAVLLIWAIVTDYTDRKKTTSVTVIGDYAPGTMHVWVQPPDGDPRYIVVEPLPKAIKSGETLHVFTDALPADWKRKNGTPPKRRAV